VPLDPDYPAERVDFILSACEACAVITTKELGGKIKSFPGADAVCRGFPGG